MLNLPDFVKKTLNILEMEGYESYIVGGCVRDLLLGRTPYDYDICTQACPCEIEECFKEFKKYDLGKKFGTITVVVDGRNIEITTFRVESDYKDNRRPNYVEFSKHLEEDLKRRDFTINAIAYNDKCGIVDIFNGVDDINNQVIRAVNCPDDRFSEDALRQLRAIRFKATLGFDIEEHTKSAIIKHKNLLSNISCERIVEEFNKLILGKVSSQALREYAEVIAVFLPEIKHMIGFDQKNRHHHLDVWEHTLLCIDNSPYDLIVRLALFFHDIGKPPTFSVDDKGEGHFYSHNKAGEKITRDVMTRLKYSADMINIVSNLVYYHTLEIIPQDKYVKRALNKVGLDMFNKLLLVFKSDAISHRDIYIDKSMEKIIKLEKCLSNIINTKQCFSLKDMAINGKDILSLNVKDGKLVGKILEYLLKQVIDEKVENTREKLIDLAMHYIKDNKIALGK